MSTRRVYSFDWDPDRACWTAAGEHECLGILSELYCTYVRLSDGPSCDVRLYWRLLEE